MKTGSIGAVTTAELGDGSPSRTAFMAIQLTGTFTATVEFEGTVDGTNWADITALPFDTLYDTTSAVTSATAAGMFRVDVAGLANVRLNCSAYTSGTVNYAANPVTG